MRRRPPRPTNVALRIPYEGALRAYAYHNYGFDNAIRQIRSMGFYAPLNEEDSGNTASKPYKHIKNCYDIFNYEAWERNRYYCFSDEETKSYGLFPMYQWICHKPGDTMTYDVSLMDSVVRDITSVTLRRAICTLLWQDYTPEQIDKILSEDPRAPFIKWSSEHIRLFKQYFWQIQNMRHNDWLWYTNFQILEADDPHIDYLLPIVKGASKQDVAWHGFPMADVDGLMAMKILQSKAFNEINTASGQQARMQAISNASKIVKIADDMAIRRQQAPPPTKENPFEEFELLIQQKKAEKLNMVPSFQSMEDLDGDISDPRDTTFDKDDYLKSK